MVANEGDHKSLIVNAKRGEWGDLKVALKHERARRTRHARHLQEAIAIRASCLGYIHRVH
jgi:hypothetical protein